MFTRLLSKEKNCTLAVLRYRQTINEPEPRIDTYLGPLSSPSFRWITSLSITAPFSVPNLVKLCKLQNLGVLEIIKPQYPTREEHQNHPGVEDRLVRTWSDAAKTEDSFRVLRVLIISHRISSFDHLLPATVWRYVDNKTHSCQNGLEILELL